MSRAALLAFHYFDHERLVGQSPAGTGLPSVTPRLSCQPLPTIGRPLFPFGELSASSRRGPSRGGGFFHIGRQSDTQ
jgi:hypothetical protein